MPDDLSEVSKLAKIGVGRILVPVTGMAGLPPAIQSPEEALSWKNRIEDMAGL
jgi:hypothetical protein